ncbi:VOC family protein [Novosphingobium sp. JCM 18896]|uniref:VOC family protein n=1 Tax=Novosphingobium sp. JCM 18896 TaxID=2989731 RepID=UPI002222A911|nr:VOC family protein [Novosphingobium sp. JCM 18896]MCW1431336.1 VOC family protein [Novosphingobium sp. JCM 18896]
MFKPNGYPALSPYVILQDPEATLAFAEAALGGELLRRVEDETGRIRHAEIRVGEVVLMIGGALADWPAQEAHLHLYVADVDATYARALALGATVVQAPETKDDADRRGGFRDPGGVTWWVATQVDPD